MTAFLVLAMALQKLEPPSIQLPPEIQRILTDYETAWQAKDARKLASLFTEDGFVLSNGRPPVRGRAAIEERYKGSGGPLILRAVAYEAEGSIGFIIGAYRRVAADIDRGKFTITMRKSANGRWLIVSDMDNGNERPLPYAIVVRIAPMTSSMLGNAAYSYTGL